MTGATLSIPGLQWNPDGYSALDGELLKLARRLDSVFLSWAIDMGCTEFDFPSFISLESLQPLAYLQSFPHLATFAFTQECNPESLTEFSRGCSRHEAVSKDENWEPSRQLLTPAACYHFYHRLAGQNLAEAQYLTTNCPCHRREESYTPLARQWCFHMRELVYIGSSNGADSFVKNCRDRINKFISQLGIEASWEPAMDPFFNPESNPAALAQQLEPAKEELTLLNGLAIGSINRHRSYFGECYNIYFDKKPARSACVAFGLERWLLAVVQAHGTNPEHWPKLAGGGQ